ncbi:hypothetical protein A2853_02060 [Candidatus Kaiserbacteria bacterium RIFCSPHIGHO2_01_FULL_55_17]|uniref:Uncharacterized protein n=1 Tax=Candidatus Kaiserbacteria bacterium RIFCSPHIGHO2_01_FULL_55_17 TaxID=1798484 RepID=A0A1F6DAL4_9BACT|nr:MAG: hypothetical protein A2853_02060 [Candidatus Kaiserbacteria bacterium RIFCSPHIGHO2_01_FULL_55_17]
MVAKQDQTEGKNMPKNAAIPTSKRRTPRQEIIPAELKLELGGQMVSVDEIGKSMAGLDPAEFVTGLRAIIEAHGGDKLKLLVDGLEIQSTPTAFRSENRRNVEVLERVARNYPFTRWLGEMGLESSAATRKHLQQWFASFMSMATEHGYSVGGTINTVSRTTNLWKATGPLASKMAQDPATYRFLPALLINHPQEVERVLGEINEPIPFLEVLVGECMEDLRYSKTFLGAFSFVSKETGTSRTAKDALWSIHLVLQRG